MYHIHVYRDLKIILISSFIPFLFRKVISKFYVCNKGTRYGTRCTPPLPDLPVHPSILGFICFVSFVVVYHCSLFSSTVATEESLGLSSFPLQPCHANNYCNIGNFSHQRNDQNILRSSTTFPSGLRFERTETTRTSSCQGIVTP